MNNSPKTLLTLGQWSVELRLRNRHPGYKPWVLYNGKEIFSYDGAKYRKRCSNANFSLSLVPEEIRNVAENYFDD